MNREARYGLERNPADAFTNTVIRLADQSAEIGWPWERSLTVAWMEYVRAAWHAQQHGNASMRDVMLTLSIAQAGADEPWTARCRDRLVSNHPSHFFGAHAAVSQALADPRVIHAIKKLELQYPLTRMRWMLLKLEAMTGAFLPAEPELLAMIEELASPTVATSISGDVRKHSAEAMRGLTPRPRAYGQVHYASAQLDPPSLAADDSGETSVKLNADQGDVEALYLSVLISIALLLKQVSTESAPRRLQSA